MTVMAPPAGRRPLLVEARGLQRYACGRGAPLFALRRYLRLLGPQAGPLPLPGWLWRLPSLMAVFEPLPLLEKSPAAQEIERRLYLVGLVTELTPWGASQSRAAGGTGWVGLAAGIALFGVLELMVLPARLVWRGLCLRAPTKGREAFGNPS